VNGSIDHNERMLWAYRTLALDKGLIRTADYQLAANSSYNASRVPASVFSDRSHGEFRTRRAQ